jgi:UDP-N-acetylglucosamine--N-acetylmuramyl-(pentapeptide) pyrophosphoryl-undecaprenol N-acetylglucosamine transferase
MFVCDKAFEVQSRGLMATASVPVAVRTIAAGKFRRYAHLTFWQHFTVPGVVWGNIRDSAYIVAGFCQSIGILLSYRPDVLFAKGGFVCLPLGIAAWLLRVPIVIHDSDTRAGLTNRVLARFATVIATGFPLDNYHYNPKRSHYIGVPIGDKFQPVDEKTQDALKQKLGFNASKKLIVATGGGLGAHSINKAMARVAPALLEHDIALYVITGKQHFEDTKALMQESASCRIVPFVFEGMHEVLGAADVVVARGSATFMQELAGLEKPVVMIPARTLSDQLKNAKLYGGAGAAEVVTDSEALGENDDFARLLIELCSNDSRRRQLAQNLHTFAKPRAAQELAQLIVSATKK